MYFGIVGMEHYCEVYREREGLRFDSRGKDYYFRDIGQSPYHDTYELI